MFGRRISVAGLAISCLGALLVAPAPARAAEPYVPPAAGEVPGYFADQLPCTVDAVKLEGGSRSIMVDCTATLLDGKTLRELSIMRNTIYARYGWDGFRKQWLRDYFHAQKWFKPNPAFSYKLISKADRYNAHVIGSMEASFTETQLRHREAEIQARHGKVWNDKTQWVWKSGKKTHACDKPRGFDNDGAENDAEEEEGTPLSWDCTFAREPWYKPNPHFSEADLTPDERIELGLIDRQLGVFSTDEGGRAKAEQSLDQLLELGALRKLSLRDLRLLRNTVYARRGRPFKSPVIRQHFRGMRWYKEDPAYSDKLLTETDRRNVRLIRSVEDELGGALRDEDWLIEPSLDGA
jgi:hypothetical protein